MSHIKVGLQYSTLGFETALDRFCLPFKFYIFSTTRPTQVRKKGRKIGGCLNMNFTNHFEICRYNAGQTGLVMPHYMWLGYFTCTFVN